MIEHIGGECNKDSDYIFSMEERTELKMALKILLGINGWVKYVMGKRKFKIK